MTHQVQHDARITFTHDVLRQSCSSRRHRASHRRLNDENLAASVTHPFTCFPNEKRSAIDCLFFERSSWRECRPTSRTRDRTSGDHTAEVAAAILWPMSQDGPRILRGAAFRARCDTPISARSVTLRPGEPSILGECSFRPRAPKRVRHGEGPERQENHAEDGKHADVREHRAEWYAVDGDLPHRP